MSQGSNPPFAPASLATVAVTNTSAAVALPGNGGAALVTNTGPVMVAIAFSTDPAVSVSIPAVGAATGGTALVLAGTQRLITCPALASYAALVTASGTATVFIERGTGGGR